jgi:coenzyme F420 hydrogenase subunit beta
MKTISDVVNNNMCIGCGLCTTEDPLSQMILDNNGFLIPKIQHNNDISSFCPGISTTPGIKGATGLTHKLWGNITSCSLGHSMTDDVRYRGSSGGVITQLAISLLEDKKITKVVQIGRSLTNPLLNEVKINTDVESVLECTGSKYSPSSVLTAVRHIKNSNNDKFLLIGRPCDVSAMRSYLSKDEELGNKIFLLVSFFCAGTPSYSATKDILYKFDLSEKDVTHFAYRGNGWPGKTTVKTDKGNYEMNYDESWGEILNKKLHLRCKVCADGIGESADIVCADGWDCDDKGYPLFTEGDGNSLVLSRTELGNKVLADLKINKQLFLEDIEPEKINYIQPYQLNRKRNILSRSFAFYVLNQKVVAQKGYRNFANLCDNGLYKTLSNFYGMFRRLRNKSGI